MPRADRNKPFGEDADSKKKKAANKKDSGEANPAPLSDPAITAFYRYHFANSGQAAVPFDGMGAHARMQRLTNVPALSTYRGWRTSGTECGRWSRGVSRAKKRSCAK